MKERISKEKIQELKEYLGDYLIEKGINIRSNFRCFSPEHEDRHPSMSFYKPANICKCFACGEKYDIFKLVGMEYGLIDFRSQLEKVLEIYEKKEREVGNVESIYEKKVIENNNSKLKNKEDYTNYFLECKKRIGECTYLQERGISKEIAEFYNLGYDPNYKVKNRETGKYETWKVIVFPVYYDAFVVRNIAKEANIEEDNKKNRMRKKGNEIFNYWELQHHPSKAFFIVEGIMDALSISQVGGKAISLNGVNNIDLFLKKIKENQPKNVFYIQLDEDKRGQQFQKELYKKMKEEGFKVESIHILEGYKDANEFLIQNPKRFQRAIYSQLEKDKIKSHKNIYEGGKNMSKIVEVIQERLEKGKENGFKGIQTVISQEDLQKATGMEKETFQKELKELIEAKKVFYHVEKEEKIAYDGSFYETEKGSPKWSFSKDWIHHTLEREEKFRETRLEKRREGRENDFQEKMKIINSLDLGDEERKVFETIHKMTEDKAYVFQKDLFKETKMNFDDFKTAIQELKENKLLYQAKIAKKLEQTGEVKEDWVITNSKVMLARILERESIKQEIGVIPKKNAWGKKIEKNRGLER